MTEPNLPGEGRRDGGAGRADSVECCKEFLRAHMAERGIDADVSAIAPVLPSPYDPFAMTCPHGVAWFMRPSRTQLAKWEKEGVE